MTTSVLIETADELSMDKPKTETATFLTTELNKRRQFPKRFVIMRFDVIITRHPP